ncbi:MAG TPA: vWA domain-containing protein, partial [Pirellulaceae bacterium]
DELGQVRARQAVTSERSVEPLLSAVIAFGREIEFRTRQPTHDLAELRQAIDSIEEDESGVEHVFQAIQQAVARYRRLQTSTPRSPGRRIMLVVFSDEVGDDQSRLDSTVHVCRREEIPVYVVGVPAPFGMSETLVKWVDPNPEFDQAPRWGRVNQGPESLLPEVPRLKFADDWAEIPTMDSGFGPFALTRLCVETGGIYFTVHPNRKTDRPVGFWETSTYAAHLQYFFPPRVMRKYRPDYVSATDYVAALKHHPIRGALVQASRESWLAPMSSPQRRFVVRDEAAFALELTEAQKEAARLEPSIMRLYSVLSAAEKHRPREATPRWQAGYDLAMGRVLALKVRTEAYNETLALAKRGLRPTEPRNNTWTIAPSDDVVVGGSLKSQAQSAREYLQRVMDEHPETPWAVLAGRELRIPFGWSWTDSYTPLEPEPEMVAENGNASPRDDQRRMLTRPKPTRPVPRL